MRLFKPSSMRHMLNEQKGGYLLLPVAIMIALSVAAIALPYIEDNIPAFGQWAHHIRWLVPSDSTMAQLLLGAIAGSCITILSVVYSVLLIALTFASIQFSPRILNNFLKDRVSQLTLGIFIGTFAYSIILLPNVHSGVRPVVPTLSLTFALILASLCLFYLIYFIQHISLSIQANHIVDRIASETEIVLRTIFGNKFQGQGTEPEIVLEPDGLEVSSEKSGYIQFVDESRLLKLATTADASIVLHRGIGQFIPASIAFINIVPKAVASHKFVKACLASIHIGPMRSMELDVEFGFLQLVDIALKALSPAVNDPSTAISCIDHLSTLLILAVALEPPSSYILDKQAVVRVIRPQPTFRRLLNIAFDQIAPQSKDDMAVSLRLMRALLDVCAATTHPPYLEAIRKQGRKILQGCSTYFSEEDRQMLSDRFAQIDLRVAHYLQRASTLLP